MTARSISNHTDPSHPTPPAQSRQWSEHEHVSDQTQIEAQRLVNTTGSAELAKKAVEQASEPASGPAEAPGSREAFAKKLGFISYLDLFEASTPTTAADGTAWLVTAGPNQVWIAWNERDLDDSRRFATREEAMRSLQAAGSDNV